ncbi:GL14839 [Drosophila persimilis]|uniref:GL14839 n=1 Tax=Drosophila persimilis TaxID=7234 RepID=B4H0J0_DROPE|nr:uncharacterized protein LOC6599178 [Drosophila persimilis]EDW29785.1 GL14839 [Drosophila persimilis]
MAIIRDLSDEERGILDGWLQLNNIPHTYRDEKEFCDALQVARIFNRIQPGLDDLISYSPCISLPLNFLNWQIFNQRVLRKLDMGVSLRDLEKLALGCPKAIDSLLFTLMANESLLKKNKI